MDDRDAIRRDHGTGMGVYVNPVDKYTGPIHDTSDAEAARREHGVGMGVYVNPVDKYTGPIHDTSDAEAARREHGAGMGVPVDAMKVYGTRDNELKEIVDNLIKSDGVSDLDTLVSRLPEEALVKVIERRYRNVASTLDDRRGLYRDVLQQLSKDINLDLNIIKTALRQGKNLFDGNINASIHIGKDNYQNVVGLLEEYSFGLEQAGIEIPLVDGMTNMPIVNPETNQPYMANELVEEIKGEARNIGVEMGADIGSNNR